MADQSSPIHFEDVPLDQARRMSRGPRMEPMLYETLRQKLQSLSSEAVRIHLGPDMTPQRMKSYVPRIARDLNVPVTVRRDPGGLIFWRSSDEDIQQAREAASRLQTARRRPQSRLRGRRPKGNPLRVQQRTLCWPGLSRGRPLGIVVHQRGWSVQPHPRQPQAGSQSL
jgi:hypothetical protein